MRLLIFMMALLMVTCVTSSSWKRVCTDSSKCCPSPQCADLMGHVLHPLQCTSELNPCYFIDDERKRTQLLNQCIGTMVAQDEAMNEFKDAAMSKLTNLEEPFVVLLVGDSGTGKTETAVKYSRAISANSGKVPLAGAGDGVIVIDCSKYSHVSDDEAPRYALSIEHDIAAQLKKCAQTVIVIEDLHAMAPKVRHLIVPSLVKGFPQRDAQGELQVGVQSSVIITSNFGTMGLTRGWSRQEITKYIHSLQHKMFEGILDATVTVIPLHAYDNTHFREIAHQLMQNEICDHKRYSRYRVGCLLYPTELIEQLADKVWDDETQREKNARGVIEMLRTHLFSKARAYSMDNPLPWYDLTRY